MEANKETRDDKSFKTFGQRVDQFLNELNEAGEKLHKEAESKERWREVESSLKRAADELSNAFKAAFRKTNP